MTEPTSAIAKPSKFKSLGLRAVSGLAMIIICGLPVYFGGWMFALLVSVFGVRMFWEWVRMTDPGFPIQAYILPVVGMLAALFLAHLGEWNFAIIVTLVTAVLAAIERSTRGKAGWAALGCIYIILPGIAILWLRGDIAGIQSTGFLKLLFILLVVIAADSWAYIGGSLLKGPKLAPKISPNKTWSGFFSGLIFGAFAGVICAYLFGFEPVRGLLLAIPVVIFSVIGDFFESAIKRHLNVKDAGGLIPGHGGLLDRVDSLMMAAVVSAIALVIWPDLWPAINLR